MPSRYQGRSQGPYRQSATRRTGHFPVLALLILALAIPAAVHGVEVYKWVDSAGKVHYGDSASAAGSGSKMEIDATPPPQDPQQTERERRSLRLLNDIQEDRHDAAAKAAAQQAREEKRKKRCAAARNRLDRYEHAGFLYQQGKDGPRRILTDAEYAKAMAHARQDVANLCGPSSANR